ncbi:MAG: hypothetical protein IKU29_02435 [Parabacteroides sp.]|nr:hypothetical protein [Parabacteroides sp.]
MTIEELFGTLQQSVVGAWRKHLKTDKYSAHEALDEFYKEMPELVDELIETWMGINGKVENYENILDSKELTSIEYLEELRNIVKGGYELFEDSEMISKLDDIMSQIDSTLYKLKELKESKRRMKTLNEYIKESLNTVNESSNWLCLVSDHFDPDTLYIVSGDTDDFEERLEDTDFHYDWIDPKSKLITISWNDESIYSSKVPGRDLNDAKKLDLKHIQQQLDEQKSSIEKDHYAYIHSNIFGSENEWDGDFVVNYSAEDYLNCFIEIIQDSYVDGDSRYCYALVDIKRKQTLLGGNGGIEFIDAQDFIDSYL